jgi:outer membrane protein OmpA-like peptidoglycan-associated protein
MKMKKLILSTLMLTATMAGYAQETAAQNEQKGTTEYVFAPHWFLQLQAGGQYTTGECDFGKLISPNVQIGIGRQFTPVIGARLALKAWQGKMGYEKSINTPKESYKFTYFNPSLDLMINFAGFNYSPKHVVDYGIIAGIGANFRSKMNEDDYNGLNTYLTSKAYNPNGNYVPLYENKSATLVNGKFGAFLDFKVSDAVKLGLEATYNLTGSKFNLKNEGGKDGSGSDSYVNVVIGAKIALGKTYTTRFIPAPEPEIRYVDKIVEKIVEVEKPAPVVEPLRRDIFFEINKTIIRDSETQKVKDIADYLNAHPTAKVMITGYADAGTGNDKINDRLAKGRADVVVKALKEQYGIAESRISFDSKGSRVQPFADNDSNRVSICIAE